MSEFSPSDQLPDFRSPGELKAYLGELPRTPTADEFQFIEEARWMVEDWHLGKDADRQDSEFDQLMSKTDPRWETEGKRHKRRWLGDAASVDEAIDNVRTIFTMNPPADHEELADMVGSMVENCSEQTALNTVTAVQLYLDERSARTGRYSVTHIIRQLQEYQHRFQLAWQQSFPGYRSMIGVTGNSDSSTESFVIPGDSRLMIVDYTHDLPSGRIDVNAFEGQAQIMYDEDELLVDHASLSRQQPLTLNELQMTLLREHKQLFDWCVVWEGHWLNSAGEQIESLEDDKSKWLKDRHRNSEINAHVDIEFLVSALEDFLKDADDFVAAIWKN